MDISVQRRSLRILHKWFLRDANVVPYIERSNIKPPFGTQSFSRLETVSPESEGISSDYILSYLNRLRNESGLHMQTVTVARNGKVISRGEFFPYTTDVWHVTHSMCKSIISLGIGMLIDDGLLSLDDHAADILKDSISQRGAVINGGIKIRHLLNMSTGIMFNEAGVISDTDWVRAFFDSTPKFRPGADFEYNSMNTYILSAVISKITGTSVSEFLRGRLFSPLGITDFHWETCPKGIEAGGFGLYIFPEDILKIGIMVSMGGVYDGKRIISEKYLKEATKKQIKTPPITGRYDYGYQMWCKEDGSVAIFNGMFGQNVIIFPKVRIVIMTTAGSSEVFQRSSLYTITEKYFGGNFRPSGRMEENPQALAALRYREKRLCRDGSDAEFVLLRGGSLPLGCVDFEGRYDIAAPDGTGLSLMPELYQLVHNNFAKGLVGIDLSVENEKFFVTFREADGERRVRVGFSGYEESSVEYGGEVIVVRAYGMVTDGVSRYMRIHFCFPELPNSRILTFRYAPGGLKATFDEAPGYRLFSSFMKQNISEGMKKRVERLDRDGLFEKQMKNFMRPVVQLNKRD